MIKQYYILILALLLTSCASPPSPIALSDTKALHQGEVLVFGRVRVIQYGESIDWDSFIHLDAAFRIHLLPDAGAKPISYQLTGDGSFAWHLPPGRYSLTGFHWDWGGGGTMRRQLFAQFRVPEERALLYIGTLVIGLDEGGNAIQIKDEHEEAIRWLTDKFAEIPGEASKSLMHLEEPR